MQQQKQVQKVAALRVQVQVQKVPEAVSILDHKDQLIKSIGCDIGMDIITDTDGR